MAVSVEVLLHRIAIIATLGLAGLSASGCMSLAVGGGAHFPVSSAPTRVVSGALAFGGWYASRDRYVLDFNMGYELGPLGDKSNGLIMAGGRFTTASRGWRHPGYYGTLNVGFPSPNDPENLDAGPTGGVFRAGGGVAWTAFSHDGDENGPFVYGSILLGVAYHHQEQSNIGAGDFLGVELTLVGGRNLIDAFVRNAPSR